MMWFLAVLGVLLLGGIAVVASGRGTPLAPAYDDRPDALVPAAGPLRPDDLRRVRFSLALRGYRMDEVDALLASSPTSSPTSATGPAGPVGPPQVRSLPRRQRGPPTATLLRRTTATLLRRTTAVATTGPRAVVATPHSRRAHSPACSNRSSTS